MVTVLTHDVFQQHETGAHPEHAGRLRAIDKALEDAPIRLNILKNWQRSPLRFLQNVHNRDQIAQIERLAADGGGRIDADTPVGPESFRAATYAVSAGCHAVDLAFSQGERSFCAVRPPGHHATETTSMGFCLFNSLAVAARYAQKAHHAGKILIVDFDVHHGNGTQSIFYEDPSVYYLSIHRYPFYPGTGSDTETGSGKGLGYTTNIPLNWGSMRSEVLDKFRQGLELVTTKFRPDAIFISAGFDAHKSDPIGSLSLETGDFATLTSYIVDVANALCHGRIVSMLEGGYNTSVLGASVVAHLHALDSTPY